MKTILVVGSDWKFRALLRAQLREEGFEALGFEGLDEAQAQACGAAALIFDTTSARPADWRSSLQRLAAQLPVAVVAGATDEVNVAAARVLRRPLRIGDVMTAVRELAGES